MFCINPNYSNFVASGYDIETKIEMCQRIQPVVLDVLGAQTVTVPVEDSR